jgi:arsenite methyltransferase
MTTSTDTHALVRGRYAEAAAAVIAATSADDPDGRTSALATSEALGSCCGTGCCDGEMAFGPELYAQLDRDSLPEAAVLASLGCGNPLAVADLHEGETVLDLGSGGGIDVLLSATRVGPTGRAIGVDMTEEMLALARQNALEAGATNVEFVWGMIESLPVADASVDVVISNCVINLAADKSAVFREMARVLRPGGRIGISDVVADDLLTPSQRPERGAYVGCIAGALSFREYRDGLRGAGLTDVEIAPTHNVADGMHGAIVRARKPIPTVEPSTP